MESRLPVPLLKLVTDSRLRAADIFGNPDAMITGISTHSGRVARNEMFVAVRGSKTDSHLMIAEAVERGASVLVVDSHAPVYPGVTTVRVPDTRLVLGPLAQAFHGNPTRAMMVIGCTGTNGKSTTTHIIRDILAAGSVRTALIGTLGTFWNGRSEPTGLTTPDALSLARQFSLMERDRVQAIVMEVSSHAIDQGRVAGIPFHGGVLTGLGQDHLDYHGTLESYIEVKRRFFLDHVAPTPGSVAAFNVDDPIGEDFAAHYGSEMLSFSRSTERLSDVRAAEVAFGPDDTEFDLLVRERRIHVSAPLIGAFNLMNMLGAATICHALGIDIGTIAKGLADARAIPGRFEKIDEGQGFGVVVDYAHTPDALERVLRTARRLTTGQVITVFGAGGDRDRTKRAPMGRTVGQLSDYAIMTSDNPRSEDPEQIARQILEGVLQSGLKPSRHQTLLDRRQAIEMALHLARPGDLVLIAGKGHEASQDFGNRVVPFDDREVARTVLRDMTGARAESHADAQGIAI